MTRASVPFSGVSRLVSCGVLTLVLLFTACNAREEGCLDPEASNFDVTVDRNDPESCAYPDLLLNASYRWADTLFRLNQVFDNDLAQPFIVTDAYILFSQIVLETAEQDRLVIDDRTSWYVGDRSAGEVFEVPDDFVLVDLSRFIYPFGDWSTTTFVTTASFSVGIPDSLLPTLPDTLASDKIRDPRVFYSEELMQFANARLRIITDTSTDVSNTYHITGGAIPLNFELNKGLNLGGNDTVQVAIDFQRLLGGVDLTADSTTIAMEIANRLSDAIIDNN